MHTQATATGEQVQTRSRRSRRSRKPVRRGRTGLIAFIAILALVALLVAVYIPVRRVWDRTQIIDAARLDESLAAPAQPAHFDAVDDPRHYPIDMRPFVDVVDSAAFADPPLDQSGVVHIDLKVLGQASELAYNPVTAAQYALGSYEYYLHDGNRDSYDAFLRHAEWLRTHLDDSGHLVYSFDVPSRELAAPWISAMAQGQAISVFVRAAEETGDESWLNAAFRALQPVVTPLEDGGTLYVDGEDVWLEEYPENPPSTVFNGHVFAAFGLRELALATEDETTRVLWERSVETLAANLERFEHDGWLRYDLKDAPEARKQYYQIQLDQTRLLAAMTDDPRLEAAAERWSEPYQNRDAWIRQRFYERLREALSRRF